MIIIDQPRLFLFCHLFHIKEVTNNVGLHPSWSGLWQVNALIGVTLANSDAIGVEAVALVDVDHGDLALLLLHPEDPGHAGRQHPAEVGEAAELEADAGVVGGLHYNQLKELKGERGQHKLFSEILQIDMLSLI